MVKKKRKRRHTQINPEDGLENAILKLAADDYEEALLNQAEDMESPKHKKEAKKLERFFLGAWGQLLSFGNGELIIERCRQEVLKEVRQNEV